MGMLNGTGPGRRMLLPMSRCCLSICLEGWDSAAPTVYSGVSFYVCFVCKWHPAFISSSFFSTIFREKYLTFLCD
jgi:hypothetical protein